MDEHTLLQSLFVATKNGATEDRQDEIENIEDKEYEKVESEDEEKNRKKMSQIEETENNEDDDDLQSYRHMSKPWANAEFRPGLVGLEAPRLFAHVPPVDDFPFVNLIFFVFIRLCFIFTQRNNEI